MKEFLEHFQVLSSKDWEMSEGDFKEHLKGLNELQAELLYYKLIKGWKVDRTRRQLGIDEATYFREQKIIVGVLKLSDVKEIPLVTKDFKEMATKPPPYEKWPLMDEPDEVDELAQGIFAKAAGESENETTEDPAEGTEETEETAAEIVEPPVTPPPQPASNNDNRAWLPFVLAGLAAIGIMAAIAVGLFIIIDNNGIPNRVVEASSPIPLPTIVPTNVPNDVEPEVEPDEVPLPTPMPTADLDATGTSITLTIIAGLPTPDLDATGTNLLKKYLPH